MQCSAKENKNIEEIFQALLGTVHNIQMKPLRGI